MSLKEIFNAVLGRTPPRPRNPREPACQVIERPEPTFDVGGNFAAITGPENKERSYASAMRITVEGASKNASFLEAVATGTFDSDGQPLFLIVTVTCQNYATTKILSPTRQMERINSEITTDIGLNLNYKAPVPADEVISIFKKHNARINNKHGDNGIPSSSEPWTLILKGRHHYGVPLERKTGSLEDLKKVTISSEHLEALLKADPEEQPITPSEAGSLKWGTTRGGYK